MKRTIFIITLFVTSFLFPCLLEAQQNEHCQGTTGIDINATATLNARRALQNSFAVFDASRVNNRTYCLLFNIRNGSISIGESDTRSLNIASLIDGHETDSDGNDIIDTVYIDSLRLNEEVNGTLPLLTITNNTQRRVIVTGLQMTNVKNGLKLMGTGPIEVRGSTITGSTDPALRTGQCVDVLSDGARVISSAVSNCNEGIKIAASNVFLGAETPATYETDKNTFSGNAIGIHQISGTGNKWPFNSISGGNGIVVDGGVRPVMRLEEGSIAALTCTQPEGATTVTACEIQFDSMAETGGEVEVYKTDRRPPAELQGRDYIARCDVTEANKCIFDAANASMFIAQIMCGEDIKCDFTALQTNDSSSMYTSSFKIEERRSTIIMPTDAGPIAGPSGMTGGGGEAGHELYVEGGESSGDSGKLEISGGRPDGGEDVKTATAAMKACAFSSPDGMEFKGALEMWWWLVLILPAPFALRRRGMNF